MAIAPIQPAPIIRYYQVGTSQLIWCPSIANIASPTNAELNAGTELTRDIADVSGFTVKSAMLETPDVATRFVGQIPGRVTADESALTFYSDKNRTDTRTLMPRDTIGYVVIAYAGFTVGKGNVFKVQVSSAVEGVMMDKAATLVFTYAILTQPSENVTLPPS